MELTRAVVSFHTLLCSVWAISHHSSMSSPLSDPSGKLGQRTVHACHHSNSMPRFISLVISQNVFPPLVIAFGLLNEPFQFEPCCLMSPPPPPLFPPPPPLWKHGDTVSVYTHWCSQVGRCLKLSSLFDWRIVGAFYSQDGTRMNLQDIGVYRGPQVLLDPRGQR